MAQIKIEWPAPPIDGAEIKFKAPCDCTEVTGLLLCYVDAAGEEASKEFTFRDAHGNNLAGLGNLFGAGAYVKVIVDVKRGYAYLQNADTNGYLESKTSMELLWENASPTSNFAGQTISLDLSQYDRILIDFTLATSYTYVYNVESSVGDTVMASYIWGDSGKFGHRSAIIKTTGVQFRTANYEKAENNGYCIPYRIWGIKGVST